jgi:hypothetical protein
MPTFSENVEITFSGTEGSPTLFIRSRGNGTQRYSLRVTNDADPAGGRKLIVRNEDQSKDVLTLPPLGGIEVAGKITVIDDDGKAFTLTAESLSRTSQVLSDLRTQIQLLEGRVRSLENPI